MAALPSSAETFFLLVLLRYKSLISFLEPIEAITTCFELICFLSTIDFFNFGFHCLQNHILVTLAPLFLLILNSVTTALAVSGKHSRLLFLDGSCCLCLAALKFSVPRFTLLFNNTPRIFFLSLFHLITRHLFGSPIMDATFSHLFLMFFVTVSLSRRCGVLTLKSSVQDLRLWLPPRCFSLVFLPRPGLNGNAILLSLSSSTHPDSMASLLSHSFSLFL